ncbi:hypothetical protein [Ihuprevotella massiliensis]|uniref:hypothetical protein n=1 Tax=Ihuprevotella massiliensis TaxID=1852368 RepID=UPI00094E94A9
MVEVSISQIVSASSTIVNDPNKSIFKELGISKVDIGLVFISPQVFIAKKAYDWVKDKINGNKKKERMYREIIAQLQAVIKKQQEVQRELERRLRASNASNERNQEEIRRLRQQLDNLEDVLNLLCYAKLSKLNY